MTRRHKQSDKKTRTTSYRVERLERRVLFSADMPFIADAFAGTQADQTQVLMSTDASVPQEESAAARRFELVIIDPTTPDYQSIVDDLQTRTDADFEIYILDPDQDGLTQIDEILGQHDKISALHLISHGSDGEISLGDSSVGFMELLADASTVSGWQDSFTDDGDFLIYGCDLAATNSGQNFVDTLAQLTGTDVAASDDLTGAAILGGDWQLEYTTGSVETELAISEGLQASYSHTLATNTVPGVQSTNENTTLTFNSANSNLISIVDDAGTSLTVTIAVTNGQLTLSGTAGLTLESGAYDSSSMTISGTVEAINAALDGLQYAPDSNYDGADALTITTTDSTIYQLNIDASLQGYYEFSSGSDVNDSSPVGNNDGMLNGDATVVNDAQHGDVISFDGTGDSVQITGMFANPADVTLAVWVNINSGAAGDIISLGDNVGITINQFSNSVSGLFFDGSNWVYTTDPVAIDGDGWHHIAYTFDDANNTQTLYIDGVATAATNDTSSISYTNGSNTFIGTDGNSLGYDIDGLIDDVRIYDEVLTSAEIANLANAPLTPTDIDSISITVNSSNDAPSFGVGDGVVETSLASLWGGAVDMVIQPDGKYLVLSSQNTAVSGQDIDYALTRYNADGSLDLSFGTNGTVFNAVTANNELPTSILLQPDGKILIAGGYSPTATLDSIVMRYDANGNLDTSFDADGMMTFDVSTTGTDYITGMALQSDGKIVVTGYASFSGDEEVFVARINTDGTLDASFDGDGIRVLAITANDDRGNAIAIQADGKIVVTGQSHNGTNIDLLVIRLNTDGSDDTSFDSDGIFTYDSGASDVGTTMALDGTGKIIVAGTSQLTGSGDSIVLRINQDGSLDNSFGTNGIATIATGSPFEAVNDIALQADGKIVVVGDAYNGSNNDLSIFRLMTDGSLDTGFNSDGLVREDLNGATDSAQTIAIDADGKLIVAGNTSIGVGTPFVARFDTDGSLDTRFSLVDTLDGSPTFIEGGAAVVLDVDVDVSDSELDALNSGLGDYDGASLTLVRNGSANSDDVLSFTDGNGITLVGGNLIKNTQIIGTFLPTITPGQFAITFTNANGETPTSIDVDNILRQITYFNSSDAPPATIQIDWSFDDGNSGSQGSGGALQALGSTTVTITAVNDAPNATNDSSTVYEGYADTIDLADNDSDPDNALDLNSIVITSAPINGSLIVNGDGTVTYTHDGSNTVSDSFDYTIKDALGEVSNTASVTLTVIPTLTQSASVAENTVFVTSVAGNGGESHIYQIVGGADAALFSFGGNPTSPTAPLVFDSAPDFEAPTDANGDGIYEVTVNSDGTIINFTVTVSNVNEAPIITSSSGGGTASIDVTENTTAVGTVTSTDVDGGTAIYSLDPASDDDGFFTIDSATGVLAFTAAPDFEAAADLDGNNIYEVIVKVDDGNGGVDTQAISVTVTDQAITTVSANGANTVTEGNLYTLNLSADEEATSWTINWGDGTIQTVAGNSTNVTHTYAAGFEGQTFNILASAADGSGDHFINDLIAPTTFLTGEGLYRYSSDGSFTQTFSGGELTNPYAVIVGPDGYLYVAGHSSDNVVRYNATTGAFVDEFIAAGSGGLNAAAGLAFGADGNLYVSSQIGDSILKYDGSTGAFLGTFVTTGSGGLDGPASLSFRSDGYLYVASYNTDSVLRYDGVTGTFVDTFVTAGSGGLNGPGAMTWGPDGNLYIGGTNSVIKQFDGSTGAFIDDFVTAGSGGLGESIGLSFGPDGNLYVSSFTSDQIIKYDGTTGALIGDYIVAGDGGLDGPAAFTFLPNQQVTVVNVNDAPVLDGSGGMFLTAITEDDINSSGNLVSEIIASVGGDAITDADADALEGIAIYSLDNSNGTWQYNIGAGWADVGTVSITESLLLRATDSLRFVPDEIDADTAFVSFAAWDQTSGAAGAKVDTWVFGGATAFSSVTQTASISVTAVNDAPVAVNDTTALDGAEDSTSAVLNATLLANDSDLEGDAISITHIEGTALTGGVQSIAVTKGTVNVDVSDNITFTADNNYNGAVSFDYTLSDGTLTDTATVSGTITGVNDAPTTSLVTLTAIAEDSGARLITQAELLANATDTDGPSLTATTLVINTGAGSLVDNLDGTWSYTPALNDDTAVSFTYTVTDGSLTAAGTANLDITPVNDGPVLSDIFSGGSASEGSGHTMFNGESLTDVDSADFDGGTLTFTVVSSPDSANDVLVFSGFGGVSTSGSDVLVSGVVVGSYSGGTGGTPLVINFNSDATATRAESVFKAAAIGNFSQDPVTGIRTIEAVLTDGDGGTSNISSKDVNFTATNDDPTNAGALPTDISVAEDVSSNVDLSAINFSDVDHGGGILTATLSTSTGGNLSAEAAAGITIGGTPTALTISGTLTDLNNYFNTASNVTYLHGTANINGDNADTIQVEINDNGNSGSGGGTNIDLGTVNVDITAANDTPTTSLVTLTAIAEDSGARLITQAELLANAADIDGPSLTATTLAINTGTGSLVDNLDGTWSYTPASNDDTSVSFTYTVTDGSLTATGSANLDITPVNDASVATGNTVIATEDIPLIINAGDFNFTDVEGNALTSVTVSGLTLNGGTLTHSSGAVTITNGMTITAAELADLTFTSALNDPTNSSFTYTVNDADPGVTSAVMNITVNAAGDLPVFGGTNAAAVTEDVDPNVDTLLEINGALTITDPDSGESSFQAETINGSYGDLAIDSAGSWSYSADNTQTAIQALDIGETLVETLTVTAFDGTTHDVTITINGAEDVAVVGGTATATVAEDVSLVASDTLTITDVDTSDNPVSFNNVSATIGDNGFGNFELSNNVWTFTLDNTNATIQALDVGEVLTDTFTFAASDGSLQAVTITINGTEDTPVIDSTAITVATEDSLYSYTITASDVDGDALSFIGITVPTWLTLVDNGDGTATLSGTPTNGEVGGHSIDVQVSDGTLTSNQNFTLTVANVNDDPAFSSPTTFNVAENTTAVGTVTSTDVDGGAPQYTLVGAVDDGLFNIDLNTGALTFVAGPDFETPADTGANNVYDLTVQVNDGAGGIVNQNIAVTVTNVNETGATAIVDSDGALDTVSENANIGDAVGITTFSTDTDTGDTIQYALDDDAGGLFAIDSNSGVVTVNGVLDYETATSLDITVRATSTDTSTTTRTFTIAIGDVNDTLPVVTPAQSFNVNEDALVTDPVGTVVATDTDTVGSLQNWTISAGNADGVFALDAATGAITIANTTNLNFETNSQYTLTVQVGDGINTSATQTVVIDINDINEAPTFTSAPVTNGTEDTVYTYTFTTNDVDGDALSFTGITIPPWLTLVDNGDGTATLSGTPTNTDVGGHSIDVQVSDGALSSNQSFTLTVANVNDDPVFSSPNTFNVAENNTTVDTVASADVDGGAPQYSLVGVIDDGLFSIDINSGVLTFSAGPDFEAPADVGANNVYDLTIQVNDGAGGIVNQSIAVTVTNVNETGASAIVDNNGLGDSVAEDANLGDTVGITTFSEDTDTGDTITYTLDDNAGGLFTIDSSSGVVTVNGVLDYETATSLDITVRATSTDTSATTRTFTIAIGDVNDTLPIVTPAQTFNVNEDALVTDTVGIVLGTDADTVGSLQNWTITAGNADGVFALDAATGTITIANASNLNYETTSQYTLTGQVSDGINTSSTQTVVIDINDINEAPTFASAPVTAGTEDTVYTYTITTNDADGDAVTITDLLTPAWLTLVDNGDGTATLSGTPTNADVGGHTIDVQVSDGSLTSNQNFTLTVTNVNDDPVFGSPTTFNVTENTTAVGTVTSTDVDGGAPQYTLVGVVDDGLFSIDINTGVLVFNAGPDFESAADIGVNNVYDLTVQVNDGAGGIVNQSIAITVTNVNETGASAISDTDGALETVNEDANIGDTVGLTTFSEDTDTDDTISYSLDDDAGGLFAIDGTTGVVTVNGVLDYEIATSLDITVRATSTDTSATTRTFTIAIGDINDTPPVVTPAQTFNINEDAAANEPVGSIVATDADTVGSLQNWTITAGNADGIFALDAATGAIIIANTTNLNYETTSQYTLTVQVGDGINASATQTVVIDINDVNEAPTTVNLDNTSANELVDTSMGYTVGTLSTSDPDMAETFTFSIVGGMDADVFTIGGSPANELTLTDGVLDFEQQDTYEVTVRSTDANGLSIDRTFIISVNDLNDAPQAFTDTLATPEDTPLIINMANDLLVNDRDQDGDALTLISITQPSHGFLMANSDGTWTYSPDANYNGSDQFQYELSDGSGATHWGTVNVQVQSVNDTPTLDAPSNIAVTENSTGILAQILTSDIDNDPVTLSISGGADRNAFTLDTQTGALELIASPDFESPSDSDSDNRYEVEILVTDAAGATTSQMIEVAVINANEAPSIESGTFVSSEQSSGVIGTITAGDPDQGDQVTMTITGGSGAGAFTVDPQTGEVAQQDTTAPGQYTLDIEVSDQQGVTRTGTLTINVEKATTLILNPTDEQISEVETGQDSTTPEILTNSVNDRSSPDETSDRIDDKIPDERTTVVETESNILNESRSPNNVQSIPGFETVRSTITPVSPSEPDSGGKRGYQLVLELLLEEVSELVDMATEDNNLKTSKINLTLTSTMLTSLDQMRFDIDDQHQSEREQLELIIGAGMVTSVSLTAGFVTWLLSTGSLLATALTTTPLWRRFDPIPVLAATNRKSEDRDV